MSVQSIPLPLLKSPTVIAIVRLFDGLFRQDINITSNLDETRNLMAILKSFENASGQEINMSKSEIFFSKYLSMAAQADLSKIMGVKHVLGTGTYLGLPSMVGRSKKSTFNFVKDRIWKRINSWRGRALSKAGKEIMIKSVLQSIPSHVMSVYLIPDTVIKDIERMINSYWWGGGTNNGGIKWLSWDRMAYPKAYGGLGFRDLHLFNKAMVAKQGWNFIAKPHTLVAKVYKARYFPNTTFFSSNLGHNPSYAWRSIWNSRHVLMLGCRWKIGNGTCINIMNDPWLKKEDGKWLQSPQSHNVANLHVSNLMSPNEKSWDMHKILTLFPLEIANSILAVPLFEDNEDDLLVWDDDIHGNYNVKSGYNLLLQESLANVITQGNDNWKWLWKIHAPPKTKHLLWRICKGCLPTRSRLQQRRVQCPLICPICERVEENDLHFLFGCNHNKQVWHTAGLSHLIAPHFNTATEAKDCILHFCKQGDRMQAGQAVVLLWCLWHNRNNWIWNNEKEPIPQLAHKAMNLWHDWNMVQNLHQRPHQQPSQHTQQQQIQWQTPQQGKLKCNIDAGVHTHEHKTSAGWCVRDHRGRFVLAGSSWMYGTGSANEGEAFALLEAMKMMQLRGFTDITFETDAHNIMNALQRRRKGASVFNSIIQKINCILSLCPGFEVKPIRRQANRVAHTLARAALSYLVAISLI